MTPQKKIPIRDRVKKFFKEALHAQTVEWENVAPRQNFSKGRFFLISPAGILIYKVKNELDVSRFRDRWISSFDAIARIPDKKVRYSAYFHLYSEIRSAERIKYKANLNTRFKAWLE